MLWVIKIVLIENKFTISNIISMFYMYNILKKFGYGLILVLFCKCRDISQPTSSPVGGTLIALDTAVGPDMLMVDRNQFTPLNALSAVQAMGVHEEILLLLSVVSQPTLLSYLWASIIGVS